MYALRERRVHVTQEDFEMAVAKVNRIIPHLISHVKFLLYSHNERLLKLFRSLHQVMQKDSEKNMSIKKLWK